MTLKNLIELQEKATTGPWKMDVVKNIGDNWLIGSGFGRDDDGTEPILVTDGIRASELDTGLASDDVKFIAAARNFDFAALDRRMREMEVNLKCLIKYAEWQMNEGTDYHPTLPSAVEEARKALGS